MKNIKKILDDVLKDAQPDKAYENEIFSRIKDIIKKINKGQKHIKAILGGSGAKGTWLKTFDADIFVLFDYKKFRGKSDKLSDILHIILKNKFKSFSRLHGSRDYFQIKQGKFTFEIIPILQIQKAEHALNITDVSPLHSKWVGKHRKLVNEMKLTKQFCQAQNVYGAESYLMGFSGYVCEILTVYYGSFLKLVRRASKWQDKVVVDAEKYYKGKDIFKIVNTSKLVSPLIVIDPVQKDRNAAAALSKEKYEVFKHSSKEFLKKPSRNFFIREDMKNKFLEEKTKKQNLVVVEVMPLIGKIDVIGGRLLKIYEFLTKKIIENDFRIIRNGWEWDKKNSAHFYFLLPKKQLSSKIEIEGPPIKMEDHAGKFRRKHKNSFVKLGKIYSIEKRKFVAHEAFVKDILTDKFVKERCRKASLKIL